MNTSPADQIPVYNPDTEDFTVTYDVHGNREPVAFTVPAQEIAYVPAAVADHVKTHLAHKLMGKRGIKLNPEADLEAIRKELTVTI